MSGSGHPVLCLSRPGHPGTLGIRFRAPGRPKTGITSTRTSLGLPISSRWPSLRTAWVRRSESDPPRGASEAGAGMTGTRHYSRERATES